VLDNLRKPINSSERQKRIAGKSEKELIPYYGATGQVGWIDSFITDSGYILVGEDGAPFLDLFKDKAYKIKGKTWVNNHAHILEGKKNLILNDFVLHYLNSINYREFVNGTTRLKLTKSNLTDIPFVVPPLSEQHAIVSAIEELLSDLENGKQQLQLAQKQLKVYRQSLLKWAFESKELIPFEKFIDSSQNGLSKRTGTKGKEYKVLRLADITNNIIDNKSPRKIIMDENEVAKYQIKKDDLICVRVNGSKDLVGKLIHVSSKDEIENWAFCDHFIRFSMNHQKAYSRFFHFYFSTVKVRKYIHDNMVTSAGQNTVSQGTIKNVPVPNCPLQEQQIILEELECKFDVCDIIEETISNSLQQAETLRHSILKKAFEGRLV
jgi:type I restriction enzyme S subunit